MTEARIELKDLDQLLEEHPTSYDSFGDGGIEGAVKSLAGILRTNKLDVEKRIGETIPQAPPPLHLAFGIPRLDAARPEPRRGRHSSPSHCEVA